MVRKLIIAVLACSALASCGGGCKSDLIKACVEEGDSEEKCTCVADNLEEDLSPEAFDAMVLGAQGDEDASTAAMKELGMVESLKVAGIMIGVVAKCGVTGFGK